MPRPYFKRFLHTWKNKRGFSLVELMVILVIIGILAVGVVFMFADPTAKVKASAFEIRGDFNLARAEAVRRNQNILIQFVDTAKATCGRDTPADFADCFDLGDTSQGYVICVDENGDNDCSDEGTNATDLEEKVIKTVIFGDGVKYYDFGATLPTAPTGPVTSPDGVALAANNGITFAEPPIPGVDFLYMNSDGTCSQSGSVVVYLPKKDADLTVKGKPYAIVVDSTSTGRVILERWRPDLGASGTWSRK